MRLILRRHATADVAAVAGALALHAAPFSGGTVIGPANVVSADGSSNLRALFVPNG